MNTLTYLCGGTQRRFERLLCRCDSTAGGQRYNTFRCWRFWMALALVWGPWVLRLELQGNRAGWGGEKWRTNSTWVRTGWEKRDKDCQSRRSCKGSGMKSKSFWELCFLLNRSTSWSWIDVSLLQAIINAGILVLVIQVAEKYYSNKANNQKLRITSQAPFWVANSRPLAGLEG